jgi:dUTP pyrophosphatase
MKLPIKRLPHGASLPLPCYATEGSAGLDVMAAIDAPIVIKPLTRMPIPTGIALEIAKGYEGQIRSRSGLAFKHGLFVLNAPGTIDADYRGELIVIMMNGGDMPFTIEPGMRIAQLVIAPYTQVTLEETNQFTETMRGTCGFGSTGM